MNSPRSEQPEPAVDGHEGHAALDVQPATATAAVSNPAKVPPAAAPASAAPPPTGKPKTAGPPGHPTSMWRRGRYFVVALIIAAALATTLWFTVLRPPLVSVAEVTRANVTAEIEGTGTVTADVLANISSKITGRVEQVFVAESDAVRKHQILATLDKASLKWQVESARARLSGAMESAQQREREWNREKTLVASGAVSIEDSEQYEERNAVAKSAVEAAKSDLGNAEYNLSLTQIPSLSSGIVITRWVVPGASVVPGQPMFTVADTRLIYVNANIDQSFSGKIRKGEMATVILRGREDHPLSGYVLRINPRADQATEEMVAEVAFNIPLDEFQLGQWANVYVQVGKAKNALVVPRTALMPMENKIFVFVVGAEDKIRREPLTVLADSPRTPTVAVAGNLQPGDRVVVMPMGLRPGQAIRPALVKEGQAMEPMK